MYIKVMSIYLSPGYRCKYLYSLLRLENVAYLTANRSECKLNFKKLQKKRCLRFFIFVTFFTFFNVFYFILNVFLHLCTLADSNNSAVTVGTPGCLIFPSQKVAINIMKISQHGNSSPWIASRSRRSHKCPPPPIVARATLFWSSRQQKTAYKILNAEKICKTKKSEWDGEEDKKVQQNTQTVRRGCGWKQIFYRVILYMNTYLRDYRL